MTKYAFLSAPDHGHVNPMLEIVRELVRAGDEVVFLTSKDFEAQVTATGARLHPFTQPFNPDDPGDELETMFPIVFPQVEKILLAEQPDIVVYDDMFGPGYVAPHVVKKPAVQLRGVFAGNHVWNLALMEDKLKNAPEPIGLDVFDRMINALNAELVKRGQPPLRAEVEVPPHARTIASFLGSSEALTIVLMPREYHPHGETFDEKFVFVGPTNSLDGNPDDPMVPALLDHMGDGPVLFITQGTMFNNQPEFFDMCFEAFGDSPWRVVMTRGDYGRRDEIEKSVPKNFFVAGWLPQLEVVKRTSVCLLHGGLDTVMQCLHYGVPMVVVPRMIEQMTHGWCVQELGLGRYLDPAEITAKLLRETIDSVHGSPAVRARAAEMREATHRAGGAKRAAEAIRAYAAAQARA
jgi:MGT family glycosyltransferase